MKYSAVLTLLVAVSALVMCGADDLLKYSYNCNDEVTMTVDEDNANLYTFALENFSQGCTLRIGSRDGTPYMAEVRTFDQPMSMRLESILGGIDSFDPRGLFGGGFRDEVYSSEMMFTAYVTNNDAFSSKEQDGAFSVTVELVTSDCYKVIDNSDSSTTSVEIPDTTGSRVRECLYVFTTPMDMKNLTVSSSSSRLGSRCNQGYLAYVTNYDKNPLLAAPQGACVQDLPLSAEVKASDGTLAIFIKRAYGRMNDLTISWVQASTS